MSDKTDIVAIYDGLLRTYHFSLTGYSRYEDKLTKFLDLVFGNSQVCPDNEIAFLLAVFAELDSTAVKTMGPEAFAAAVDLWRTKPLRDILFFTRESKPDHSLILSFYLSMLADLSNNRAVSAVNTFAKFIRTDIDVQVLVTQDSLPNVVTKDHHLVSLRTPRRVFKADLLDARSNFLDQDRVEKVIREAIVSGDGGGYRLIEVKQQRDNKNIFSRVSDDSRKSLLISPSEVVLDPKALDEVRQRYREQFEKPAFRQALGNEITEECSEAFFSVAIAGAFFASYYHVTLEYVLSVCRVLDDTMFTLGGLGVGSIKRSKSQNELDSPKRAILGLLSDHIAANLSAQMYYDWYDLGRFTGKACRILKLVDTPGTKLHEMLEHQTSQGEPTKEYATKASGEIENAKLEKILSMDTFAAIKDYLTQLSLGTATTRSQYKEIKEKIATRPTELWSKLRDLTTELENDGVHFEWRSHPERNPRVHIDVDWVLLTFKTALQNLTPARAFNPTQGFIGQEQAGVDLGFSTPGAKTLVDEIPQGTSSVALHVVLTDNGVGCDVQDILAGGTTGFSRWFDGTFKYVLNSHGDIWIESRQRKLSFRNPEVIYESDVDRGTRFTIVITVVRTNEKG